MTRLYHGTLARNIPSISAKGLLPQKGTWTGDYYENAEPLVYAVDETRKGRLLVPITAQMAKAGLVSWSDGYAMADYNRDLELYAAVVVLSLQNFREYPGFFEDGHPVGAEPGDWYSREPVEMDGLMIGKELVSWLKPGEVDFEYRYKRIIREILT